MILPETVAEFEQRLSDVRNVPSVPEFRPRVSVHEFPPSFTVCEFYATDGILQSKTLIPMAGGAALTVRRGGSGTFEIHP